MVVSTSMTQAQLDVLKYKLNTLGDGFATVNWKQNDDSIDCSLNEKHRIVVKKGKKTCITILLYTGKKYISLPLDVFETVCDLKVSVELLAAFLEGHTT